MKNAPPIPTEIKAAAGALPLTRRAASLFSVGWQKEKGPDATACRCPPRRPPTGGPPMTAAALFRAILAALLAALAIACGAT